MNAKNRQRLAKIEGALTPKQAVVAFLNDRTRQFQSIFEMHQASRSLHVDELPRPKIGRQIASSVRAALKAQGHKQPAIDRAVRRAAMDADFLLMLAAECNQVVVNESKSNWLRIAHLGQRLRAMLVKNSVASTSKATLEYLSRVPYPLFVDDVAAVQAAIRHRVLTWRELEENRGFLSEEQNPIEGWVRQHFIRAGRRAIPLPLHAWRQLSGLLDPDKDPELCERYTADTDAIDDPATLEAFMGGKDFTHGLADVTDDEFESVYSDVLAKLRDMVEGGTVCPGRVVGFDSVPLSFLNWTPLLEDEWLDDYVVELAEWGALLTEKGYAIHDNIDDHALSIAAIFKPESDDGGALDANWLDVQLVREEVRQRLSKFKGRTKTLEGRTCVSFADYAKWKERKGTPSVYGDGFSVASFNRWVEMHQESGQAVLAGVPVDNISVDQSNLDFYALNHATEALIRQQDRRATIRRINERLAPGVPDAEVCEWRDEVTSFAGALYCLHDAISSLEKRYLDGTPVLFHKVATDLRDQIDRVDALIDLYNGSLRMRLMDEDENKAPRIDRCAILDESAQGLSKTAAFLIARAKVETLWAFDDVEGALNLLWPYESDH